MSENKKTSEETQEAFYAKLKKDLNIVEQFPTNFTYKFIVPTDHKKIAEIQAVFDNANPQFQMKESSKGKYTSITAVVYALDADQVIHYYKKVGSIDGVIML
ncbi:MAG: DUF493 family protein [Weeksellaceae bacterium]